MGQPLSGNPTLIEDSVRDFVSQSAIESWIRRIVDWCQGCQPSFISKDSPWLLVLTDIGKGQ